MPDFLNDDVFGNAGLKQLDDILLATAPGGAAVFLGTLGVAECSRPAAEASRARTPEGVIRDRTFRFEIPS
jgi:hypothetical protein